MQSKDIFISILVKIIYILPSTLPAECFPFFLDQLSMNQEERQLVIQLVQLKMQIAFALFCILILLEAIRNSAFSVSHFA